MPLAGHSMGKRGFRPGGSEMQREASADAAVEGRRHPLWRDYARLIRVDHWFKNVLVLPGTLLASYLEGTSIVRHLDALVVGLASACLVASANYVLNEWIDRPYDRFHPIKKHRPSVAAALDARLVWLLYGGLTVTGLALGALVSPYFLATAVLLWLQGIAYNVPPLRTKDRTYLDVLSESVNNPIRLLLGWFIVAQSILPPASLVIGYWMLGAFLMTVKRYAEFRFIGAPAEAALYRRSFRYYTEETLLIAAMFCACASSFFLGVFLVKYRVELLLTLPLLAFAFAWYMHIGMKPASAAQTPEHLYKERGFVAYVGFTIAAIIVAFAFDVPALRWFLDSAFLELPGEPGAGLHREP